MNSVGYIAAFLFAQIALSSYAAAAIAPAPAVSPAIAPAPADVFSRTDKYALGPRPVNFVTRIRNINL